MKQTIQHFPRHFLTFDLTECSRMFHMGTVQRRNKQPVSGLWQGHWIQSVSTEMLVVVWCSSWKGRDSRKGVLSIYIRTMSVSSWAWSLFFIVHHPKFLSVDRRGLFELVWADFSASFSRISRVRVKVNEDFSPRPRLNGASVDGLAVRPVRLLRECTSRRSHS